MQMTDRQSQIRDLLADGDFLTVEALAQRLAVAPQTIRRDVKLLCDLGLARRRHGGVEPASPGGNLAYAARRTLNRNAKLAIASTVAARIPNEASISFGIGTTPAMVMDALIQHEHLRVYTNNLSAALSATANHNFQVHIAGGQVRNSDQDVTGQTVEQFFSNYKSDIGIFGVGGVDPDGCLLDFSDEEVRIRESILRNCRQSFLVLDASKFGRSAHVRGGWISDVDIVFCDQQPPPAIADALIAGQRELVVCTSVSTL